jgi:hypothetical protein
MQLQRMVRVGDMKLIWYPKPNVFLLFDLAKDPHELRDLAGDPAQRESLARLKRKLPSCSWPCTTRCRRCRRSRKGPRPRPSRRLSFARAARRPVERKPQQQVACRARGDQRRYFTARRSDTGTSRRRPAWSRIAAHAIRPAHVRLFPASARSGRGSWRSKTGRRSRPCTGSLQKRAEREHQPVRGPP